MLELTLPKLPESSKNTNEDISRLVYHHDNGSHTARQNDRNKNTTKFQNK